MKHFKFFEIDNTPIFGGYFCTHKKVYKTESWNSGENKEIEYITLTFDNNRRVTFKNDENNIAYKEADFYLKYRFLFNLFADLKNWFNSVFFKEKYNSLYNNKNYIVPRIINKKR